MGYLFLSVAPGARARPDEALAAALDAPWPRPGAMLEADLSDRGTAFLGIAIMGDRLVRTAEEADAATGAGRGNYLLARHAPDGSAVIEHDPFGYYPIHIYDRDGVFCAGSDPARMAEVLGRLGREIIRDLTIYGWFLMQGSGGENVTAHREFTLLPPGAHARVDPHGVVTIHRRHPATLIYGDRPLAEAIDDAASEILINLRVLATAPFEHRVCDLTGGMDSRLVLAGLLHEGLEGAFVFDTKGNHPHPDVNTAALIRRRFGLAWAGRIAPRSAEPGRDPLAALKASVARSGGLMSSFIAVGRPLDDRAGILSIGGGTGGTMRRFLPSGLPDLPPWRRTLRRVRRGLTSAARPTPEDGALHTVVGHARTRGALLRPEAREAIVGVIAEIADDAASAGIAPEHMGSYYYLQGRARYHFGVWWAANSGPGMKARFHPLYSPAAVRAAHALPVEDQTRNRLGFEIMRRLSPELTRLPFADKSWHPSIMEDAPAPITAETPYQGLPDEPRVHAAPPRERPARAPRRERTETERTLRATGERRRVVELGETLEAFGAADRDYAALEPIFDADAVRRFMSLPHEAIVRRRYGVQSAYRIMAAHIWAHRAEAD